MGGEWPKTVGEHGEAVAAMLLNTLGWGEARKGVPVKCIKQKPHASGDGTRQNHDVDFLFS